MRRQDDRYIFQESGNPTDSQALLLPIHLKDSFYIDDGLVRYGVKQRGNKAVDLKTLLRYRWDHQDGRSPSHLSLHALTLDTLRFLLPSSALTLNPRTKPPLVPP